MLTQTRGRPVNQAVLSRLLQGLGSLAESLIGGENEGLISRCVSEGRSTYFKPPMCPQCWPVRFPPWFVVYSGFCKPDCCCGWIFLLFFLANFINRCFHRESSIFSLDFQVYWHKVISSIFFSFFQFHFHLIFNPLCICIYVPLSRF